LGSGGEVGSGAEGSGRPPGHSPAHALAAHHDEEDDGVVTAAAAEADVAARALEALVLAQARELHGRREG
jgi:hypothetical protein